MTVSFDRVDLDFILRQILMAEAGQPPVNPHLAFGLRQVAGTNNSAVPGQSTFGSIDQSLPAIADPLFQAAQAIPAGLVFPAPVAGTPTNYTPGTAVVVDSTPRTISNLIADQSAQNPAALAAYTIPLVIQDPLTHAFSANPAATDTSGVILATNVNVATGAFTVNPLAGNLAIPNVTPDGGISAPFNSWTTLFGQFFDHGLDLVNKSASEVVFIPLKPDDPLFKVGGNNFMILARAIQPTQNLVTPHVDQNQTYTSHPSHQAFLREYEIGRAHV